LQPVVHPNLTLIVEVGDNRLPNGCDKCSARKFGASHVSKQQQEGVLDQLNCRAIIKHEEDIHEDYELEEEDNSNVEDAPDAASSDDEIEDEEA
jgi:predicted  nucleic acid-binding Zn-ribbon protein